MRRSQKSQFDYHSYRGRTTLTDWLKRIALVLAVLVALAVAIVYFAPDLLPDSLPGPGSSSSQQGEPQSPDGSLPGGTEDPSSQPDVSQPQEEQGASQPASALISVPLSAVLDGSAAQLVQQAGADGAVVTMKDDAGALGWQSEQPLASQTMDGADAASGALTQWLQGDVYAAARLSCFRDEALGSQMDYTLRTSSDYRWQDGAGAHWTTPSNPAVREYLIGLMTELAQMGFDEIVLEHWGYPAQSDGPLDNLKHSEDNYPAAALDPVITDFLSQAAQALEPYGTRLSLAGAADMVSGVDFTTGLTAAASNTWADRLWVSGGSREEVTAALENAGIDNLAQRLVLLTGALDPASQGAQAVWSE